MRVHGIHCHIGMTQPGDPAISDDVNDRANALATATATAAFVRARDWDDNVCRAWRAAVAAVHAADAARAALAEASVKLASARGAAAAIQALSPPRRGEGAHRARQWHEASAALRDATVGLNDLTGRAEASARAERLRVMEFEHARDDSPYVAALWRECIRLGAIPNVAQRCREEPLV